MQYEAYSARNYARTGAFKPRARHFGVHCILNRNYIWHFQHTHILPQELSSALLTWREFRHAPAAAGSGGICWHVFMRRWQLVVAVVVVIPPETPSLSAR